RHALRGHLPSGITSRLGLQAVVNLGVVLASLPTKGLPLPFVSFAGSTLVVDLFAAGVLLAISRGAPEPAPVRRPPLLVRLAALLAAGPGNKKRGHRVVLDTADGSAA